MTASLPRDIILLILQYLPPTELYHLRSVNTVFHEAALARHFRELDLSFHDEWMQLPFFTVSDWRLNLKRLDLLMSHWCNSTVRKEWVHSLHLTPHIELLESMRGTYTYRPIKIKLKRAKLGILRILSVIGAGSIPRKRAHRMSLTRSKKITAIIPLFDNIRILRISERSDLLFNPFGAKPLPPSRCAYFEVLWQSCADNLTTLDVCCSSFDQFEEDFDTWRSYSPPPGVTFPNLQYFRLAAIYSPFSSSAPVWSLIELVKHSPKLQKFTLAYLDSSAVSYLPTQTNIWPFLRSFEWKSSTPITNIPSQVALLGFFELYKHQWEEIAIDHPIPQQHAHLDILHLRSLHLSIEFWPESGYAQFWQVFETGDCTLENLSLRVSNANFNMWHLGRALRVMRRLKELDLWGLTFSLETLEILASSAPQLCILNLREVSTFESQSDRVWYIAYMGDVIVPFELFAEEILGSTSADLTSWGIRDFGISLECYQNYTSEFSKFLVAISDRVPSIYSFFGMGHTRLRDNHRPPRDY